MTLRSLALSLLASTTLSGCMGLPYFHPETAALCKAEPGTEWQGAGTLVTLYRDGVAYSVDINERRDRGDDAYWIQLSVRATRNTPIGGTSVTSGDRPPMLYDPHDAWIEVNGRRTGAVPVVWQGKHVGSGKAYPGPELQVPANINPQNAETLNDAFIRFDMPPPQARDKYRFNPGSITIGGVKTPLPVFASCFTPMQAGLDIPVC